MPSSIRKVPLSRPAHPKFRKVGAATVVESGREFLVLRGKGRFPEGRLAGRDGLGLALYRTFAMPVMALCLAVVFFSALPAIAQDQPPMPDWGAGDTASVLAQWLAAAESGDPHSMLALGRSYRSGLGVRQDATLAFKWLSLAARFGVSGAADERDALALNMTPEDLARGEMLARDWRPRADARSRSLDPGGESKDAIEAGPPPREAIREAQFLLANLGYAPGPADGVWGTRSIHAYGAFLQDSGLAPSGTLTPEGLLALRSAAGRSGNAVRDGDPPDQPAAADAPPREAIREAQELLEQLGYASGPPDGVWGTRSNRAYERFLRDAGLPPADVLTPNALLALRAIVEERMGRPPEASQASADRVRSTPPREAVQEAQSLLSQLGYSPGPPDGVWDSGSSDAYQRFLHDIGLPPSDVLVPESLPILQWVANEPRDRVAPGADPATVVIPDVASRTVLKEAQILLTQLGYAPGAADGVWGRRSVEDYQRFLLDAGLSPTDSLAPEGLLALRAIADKLGRTVVAQPELRPAGIGGTVSPEAIRDAQLRLAQLGYAPGPADGVWGKATKAEYRRFLRDAGLPPGDVPSLEGLRSLRIRAAAAALPHGIPATGRRDVPRPVSLLHRLVEAGNVEVLESALALGADPDVTDGQGWTPLMHAVTGDRLQVIRQLIAAGVDVNARAADGSTALTLAVSHGSQEAIALLIEAGADTLLAGPGRQDGGGIGAREIRQRNDCPGFRHACGRRGAAGGSPLEAAARVSEEGDHLPDERSPGAEFRDCPECPEMVVLPAGYSGPDSPDNETGRREEKGQMHRAAVLRPFAIGKYEVKREEFEFFVEETGHASGDACRTHEEGTWRDRQGRGWKDPGFSQDSSHPVVCVAWTDAKAFARWLSQRTGNRYRLLSESEWEYAVRGPAEEAGRDTVVARRAGRGAAHRRKTAPVGSFGANAFRLHDMQGNAWEWVEDCWRDSDGGASVEGSAGEEPATCQRRVVRGGGWDSGARRLRLASRAWRFEWSRSATVGFRVAREIGR